VETLIRRLLAGVALVACVALAHAGSADNAPGGPPLAHGARDGDAPAWAVTTEAPIGWTRDCCTYARAIGVDAVLYRGEWSGKPQRVIVLNVSPRKLPTLADEIQADRTRYRQLDPAVKLTPLIVRHRAMPCQATMYQGSDHVDDVVVLCDPGKAAGVRLSWSLSFDDGDPSRRALLDDFWRVVLTSRYQRYMPPVARAAVRSG
jgi:hypothetical protein